MRPIIEVIVCPATASEVILRVVTVENASIFLLLFFFSLELSSSLRWVVFLTAVSIILKYLPKPLQKFQIVLILAFDKLLHFNILQDLQVIKSLLQYFEIMDKLIVEFGLPVHLTHW